MTATIATQDATLARNVLATSPMLGSCSTHVRFAHGLHVGASGKMAHIVFSSEVDAYNARKGK